MRPPDFRFPVVAECAGVAVHVTQRSRGRFSCFSSAADRLRYLALIAEAAQEQGCAVHAYALLDNHAHLLATPRHAGTVSRMMRVVSERYAQHLRDEGPDAGFEPSHQLRPVHLRQQLFECMRYIEDNPVRARLARQPQEWRWSSFRANALGEADALLTPHPLYFALGRDVRERGSRYRAFFEGRRGSLM